METTGEREERGGTVVSDVGVWIVVCCLIPMRGNSIVATRHRSNTRLTRAPAAHTLSLPFHV